MPNLLYLKYSELNRPGPDRISLFIDQSEDAINWGNYIQDMSGYSPYNPALHRWLDIPGSYHGNACGIAYCDGHSEIKKWGTDAPRSRSWNDYLGKPYQESQLLDATEPLVLGRRRQPL